MRQLISPHRLWQLAIDAAIVAAAWWLAFQLRFDHGPNLIYSRLLDRTILLVVGIKLIVFIAFRLVDILKPWPINRSQKLSGGLGITIDDLLAAGFVNLIWLIPAFR